MMYFAELSFFASYQGKCAQNKIKTFGEERCYGMFRSDIADRGEENRVEIRIFQK